jgi:hypothetical protein
MVNLGSRNGNFVFKHQFLWLDHGFESEYTEKDKLESNLILVYDKKVELDENTQRSRFDSNLTIKHSEKVVLDGNAQQSRLILTAT